jgi:hypothetical protein
LVFRGCWCVRTRTVSRFRTGLRHLTPRSATQMDSELDSVRQEVQSKLLQLWKAIVSDETVIDLDSGPLIVAICAILLEYPVVYYLRPGFSSNCLSNIPLRLFRASITNSVDADRANPPTRYVPNQLLFHS